MDPTPDRSVERSPSLHWSAAGGSHPEPERLAVEGPLCIEAAYDRAGVQVRKVLGITMRTPGDDDALALGFLAAEGLVEAWEDINTIETHAANSRGEPLETRAVHLRRAPLVDVQKASRSLMTSSACGLCGRSGLEGLPIRRVSRPEGLAAPDCALLASLPALLRANQPTFDATGGTHGAALFDSKGHLQLVREDVGRHNAVDKLVGAALMARLPIQGAILVLSGRASFELLQKAASADLGYVVAVGAPSSAAVALAHAAGITLAGFARGDRLNLYTHADRLQLAEAPPSQTHDPKETLSVR